MLTTAKAEAVIDGSASGGRNAIIWPRNRGRRRPRQSGRHTIRLAQMSHLRGASVYQNNKASFVALVKSTSKSVVI